MQIVYSLQNYDNNYCHDKYDTASMSWLNSFVGIFKKAFDVSKPMASKSFSAKPIAWLRSQANGFADNDFEVFFKGEFAI